jgi:hypothetical protein
MSESEHPSIVIDAQAQESPSAPASSPESSSPGAPPAVHALLELIGRGLAPDADPAVRAQARELWTQCAAGLMANGAPVLAPAPPPLPSALPMPVVSHMHGAAAAPPVMAAMQALKHMSPDQLLDTALQRLRAALPSGTNVPASRGIQFHLVPIPPPPSGAK